MTDETFDKLVEGQIVIHIKHKTRYVIVSKQARMKVNEQWNDCVIYRPIYDNVYDMFAREKMSFVKSFDIENENTTI